MTALASLTMTVEMKPWARVAFEAAPWLLVPAYLVCPPLGDWLADGLARALARWGFRIGGVA